MRDATCAVMNSSDVLHSFWVPAFRTKQDVVPGRYTRTWFEAKEPGTYGALCTEYCGTQHSNMKALVVAKPKRIRAMFKSWMSWLPR